VGAGSQEKKEKALCEEEAIQLLFTSPVLGVRELFGCG
jgi:hypothetical protein